MKTPDRRGSPAQIRQSITRAAAIVSFAVISALGLAGASNALLLSTGYSDVVIADDPLAYWRLGEAAGTFADSSSSGTFPGTLSGFSEGSLFLRAQPGGIVDDDGAVHDDAAPSGYNQYPNGAFVQSPGTGPSGGQDPFTLEIWAKPLSHGSSFAGGLIGDYNMEDSGSWDVGVGLYLNWPLRQLTFARAGWDNGADRDVLDGPVLPASTWSHLVATYDAQTMRVYVNGALADSLASTRNIDQGIAPVRIGMFRMDYGVTEYPGFFYGSLDEAAVYDRALSAQEIAEHYAAGTGSLSQLQKQSFGTRGRWGTHALTASVPTSDPVNTLTGAFTESVEDLALPGTGVPLNWTRTYTSADPTVGRLGPGWTDSYSVSLAIAGNGDVTLHGDEGQQVEYTKQGDGSFVGAAGARSTLETIAGGYRLTRQDQLVYLFGTQGRVTSVKDRNGEGVTLAYDGQSRLVAITDAAGRQATVSYNASNLVSQVSLDDGRSVSYGYTSDLLTSVIDVRGKTWMYTYDAGGRLATIVDPLSHTQVTNMYGADGRVSSQADAVGKMTTFAWDPAAETATITDPNNHVWKDVYASEVLFKQIDPLTNTTELGHDGDLNDTSVKGPTGEQTTMTYDTNGNLLTATAPPSLGGAQKTFVYNTRNDPTQVTDARGKVTTYTYDSDGNVETVTQDGTQVGSYTYDSAGRVLTSTDGNSKTTTTTYDPNGNVASVTDPLGNKTTFTYDAAGRVLTRVDPKGNVVGCGCASQFTWSYTYNLAGQVLTETDPVGNVTTHTYDDAGNELTVTDANGKTTTYTYDDANRLLTMTAPDTGVTSYTYDDAGNKLTETDPLDHTTTYTYDNANRLASTTTASGATTTFFYDANGNLGRQVEPRGNVQGANPDDYDTLYTYDAAGRVLIETDPLGNVTTHTYDAVGNELTVRDANNKTTTYTYDGKNHLSNVTAPDTGVTTYTYDNVGNELTEKDPRNNITTFTYDDANRLVSETKPSGGKTTYGYDANANRTSKVEPRGNVAGCGCASQYRWTYAFDRANRRMSKTSPLGHTTTFAYDAVGNELTVTDAKTRATTYTYDAVNRLKTVTAPDLGVTAYTYDLAGNLTQRQDARNNITTYVYDVDNRRTSVTNPLSKVWTTTYDAASNVQATVAANGNETPAGGDGTTTYTYDRAGRLTGIDYSDLTPDVTFTYDSVGNRLSMVDGSGTESRTYDSVNRPLTVTRGTNTFSYTYDLAGNLASRTYPGSFATTYTYDPDNRLATVAADSLTTSYAYDPAGNAVATTLPSPSQLVETRVYDASGRLVEVNTKKGATVRARFVVTRDQVGNPTRVDRTGSLTETQTYGYDASDRLTSVCFQASCPGGADPKIVWTYDLVGNRLAEQRTTGMTNYTYNAGDQMLTAGSTSYNYDANGNQVSAGPRTFIWDLANRLRSTTSGTTTTTYMYNGDGVRLQSSTGVAASAKTNFLWDINHGLPQVALERNGNNVLQRRYTYGLQRLRQANGTASYYAYDALGSVSGLLSNTGGAQRSWGYEPYGTIRTSSGTSPPNFLQFTGEYLDPIGLYHLRARQYDSSSGRFTTVDPLEEVPTSPAMSPYIYADDRPTTRTDPSGMKPELISESQLMASFSSATIDPTAGNQCTVVPDAIHVKVLRVNVIDFSFSCANHDTCYGRWVSWRKSCDNIFHIEMKDQCADKYDGWWTSIPVIGNKPGKTCNAFADLYHYGVEQLGNLSWFDKADRLDRTPPLTGCPYSGASSKPDVPRCRSIIKKRSYPPFDPDVKYVTIELLKQLARAMTLLG